MPVSQRVLYVDAFAGISGDMFLGALADLGLEAQILTSLPARLGFEHASLTIQTVIRQGIAAKQVCIEAPHEHVHRHIHHIQEILQNSDLPAPVSGNALKTFSLLAGAEAKIHGTTPEKIHFHEVGAVDSILDIVGTHLALHELGVDSVLSSPLPLSRGMARMAHGHMPLPAPATVEILRGAPTRPIEVDFESVTPTGAALVMTLAQEFRDWPAMTITKCGWGAGSREGGNLPNLLRLVLGEMDGSRAGDRVWVLECEVDDMLPEFFEPLWTTAFERGALDLYLTPVQMKKGRPGTLITLLVHDPQRLDCERLLLEHTTTFGVRRQVWERTLLDRQIVEVETEYGRIPLKVSPGLPGKAAPEASAVKEAAAKAGVSMAAVSAAAVRVWRG
jgi:uncharacterized protein (TIGR00299 family) protein